MLVIFIRNRFGQVTSIRAVRKILWLIYVRATIFAFAAAIPPLMMLLSAGWSPLKQINLALKELIFSSPPFA